MTRCFTLALLAALLCSCVAREAPSPEASQLAVLKAALQRVRAAHPELLTPREISLARVRGDNGWPAIEAAGLRFHELQQRSAWGALESALPETWRTQFDDADGLMQAALGDTFPFLAEIDAALAKDCLVPVWDEGFAIMPGMYALNLLRLRASIQLHRREFAKARAEVQRMVEIAWRIDAAWSRAGLALSWGLRSAAVAALLRLTNEDRSATNVVDAALTMPGAESAFHNRALFDLAVAVEAAEAWLNAPVGPDRANSAAGDNGLVAELVLMLEHLSLLAKNARESNWRMERPEDAREYLAHSHRYGSELQSLGLRAESRSADREARLAIELILRAQALPVILQLRKLDLTGELGAAATPPAPEHMMLTAVGDEILVKTGSTHPLSDPEAVVLATYPRLKQD